LRLVDRRRIRISRRDKAPYGRIILVAKKDKGNKKKPRYGTIEETLTFQSIDQDKLRFIHRQTIPNPSSRGGSRPQLFFDYTIITYRFKK